MRFAVDKDCIWYAVLVYGYGVGPHLLEAVHCDCSFFEFSVCVTHQNVRGGFRGCRQRQFVDKDIVVDLK